MGSCTATTEEKAAMLKQRRWSTSARHSQRGILLKIEEYVLDWEQRRKSVSIGRGNSRVFFLVLAKG